MAVKFLLIYEVTHFQGKTGQDMRVVGTGTGHAAGDHIAIPDRFDFLHVILIHQRVKMRKNLV